MSSAITTMVEAEAPWQYEFQKMKQRCSYLYKTGQWSDCIFMVGSETNQEKIPAHKLFLASSSPVFEAMFHGGLSERRMISIPDVEPQAFKDLLLYIYTGNLNIGTFDAACDLWYGAKKYMLPHLEIECINYIWSVLGPKNVCKAYEFARLFDNKTLMDICIQIIITNTKEVLNDNSFEDVELNTVITVFSLEHLNVDSEIDLFHALVRYAKAGQRMDRYISPMDGEPPPKKLLKDLDPSTSEKNVLLPSAENSSRMSPAEEPSSTPSEMVTSEPTDEKCNYFFIKEEEVSIRTALQQIRFLSLSAAEFEEGPARSDLLTEAESLAVLENITSRDSAVPMPTGFSACRERRQPRTGWMDDGIEAYPTFKPSDESEAVFTATQLPTPAEIVRDLLSRDRETLEDAARAARRLTCDGFSHRSYELVPQLVAAGGIPPLIAALHHPGTGVQYDAAWALTNIGCSYRSIQALVNDGAVPVLVGLIGGGGVVAEQAAWALGNIATSRDYARVAALEAGAGPALLAHLQPSTASAPLATYLRTYRILCQNTSARICSPKRPAFKLLLTAVPYIENLLVLDDEQVLVEACWILRHLASAAFLNLQLFTPSLVASLTACLRTATPRVQAAALAALENMLGAPELVDRYIEAGCLDDMIYFLRCENPALVEEAASAVNNIMYGTHLQIQQALDKGILDALGLVLTKENEDCNSKVADAIYSLCLYGSSSQIQAMAEAAALQPYCGLLGAEGPAGRNVPSALTAMLKNTDENTKPVFLRRLREMGVPELIIPYQQHENKSIQQDANDLLENFKLSQSVDNMLKDG